MLAKAVATEAGANFINVSMSSIASKVLTAILIQFVLIFKYFAALNRLILAVVW